MRHSGLVTALLATATIAGTAAETPAVSAKRFVDRLYGLARPEVPDAEMYTPELAKLMARAGELGARTGDPDVVGDPLCECQNLNELHARTAVVSATPDAASVRVLLTGGIDGPQRFLLKLVHGRAGWRLADSLSDGRDSYAAGLRAELAGK